LSITFFSRLKIINGFLKLKFRLIYQLLPIQIFWIFFSTMQNEVLNSTSNTIPTFWQWVVKLSSSNDPIPFEDSWWKLDLTIKMTSPPFIPTNANNLIFSFCHQILLDGVFVKWQICICFNGFLVRLNSFIFKCGS